MLTGTGIATRGLNVLLFWLVARNSGAQAAGVLSLGIAYKMIASRLSYWGLDQILIREGAKEPSILNLYTSNFIALRVIITFITILIVQLLGRILLPAASEALSVIWWMSWVALTENINDIIQAGFMAVEDGFRWMLTGLIFNLLPVVLCVPIVLQEASVVLIAFLYFIGSFVGLVLNFLIGTSKLNIFNMQKISLLFCITQMKLTVPFALIGGFFILNQQMAALILPFTHSEKALGIYNAAALFINAIAIFPRSFRLAVFPVLSKTCVEDRLWRNVFYKSFFSMLYLAVPFSLGGFTIGPILIQKAFSSPDFIVSKTIIKILSWVFIFLFPNVTLNRALISRNYQNRVALNLFQVLILNSILSFTLSMFIGASGVAVSQVISEAFFFFLNFICIFHLLKDEINKVSISFKSFLLASYLMGLFFLSCRIIKFNNWFGLLGANLIYWSVILKGKSSATDREV